MTCTRSFVRKAGQGTGSTQLRLSGQDTISSTHTYTDSGHGAPLNGIPRDLCSMKEDAIIVLDPVNRANIDEGLARGIKDYIGGNCTVGRLCLLVGWVGLGGVIGSQTRSTRRSRSPQPHAP